MKIALKKFIIASFVLVGHMALANTGSFTASVYNMNLHPAHSRNQVIQAANVVVDADAGQITLYLQPQASQCPANMFCPAVIPTPIYIALPLVSMEEDSCGNLHYVAQRAANQWSTLSEQIMVSDNSRNRCPSFREMAPTEINYVSVNQQSEVQIQSLLFAKNLVPNINVLPVAANPF